MEWWKAALDGRIFGKEDNFKKVRGGEGWVRKSWMWWWMTSGKLDVTKALDWTLRVVNFLEKVLGSRTRVIILIRVQF